MNKKNIKNLFIALLLGSFTLSGCQNPNNTSEPDSTPSINESETKSESEKESDSNTSESEIDEMQPLRDAISNTHYYSLYNKSGKLYEVVEDDFYYSSLTFNGYLELDDDPGYVHKFDLVNVQGQNNEYYDTLKVYGRTARIADFPLLIDFSILTIIEYYQDLFKPYPDNPNTYYGTDPALTYVFEAFFQSKIVGTCNLFEIEIHDYRLDKIRCIETYDKHEYFEIGVEAEFGFDFKEDVPAYNHWLEDGEQYSTRIMDIKQLVPSEEDNRIPVSLYENEEITITATISAFDLKEGFYVTQNNETSGPIGLHIKTKEDYSNLKIGNVLTLTGTVYTESQYDIYTCLIDTTYNVDSDKEDLPLIYDEDYLVDTYGGGTYAAMMFSNNLLFGGSIYSTFAFVCEMPESIQEDTDTIITFICPNIVDLQGKSFYFDLFLSKDLDYNFRIKLFNTIKEAGIYTSETGVSGAKELLLENVLVDYTFDSKITHKNNRGNYPISLIVLENSNISNKKNIREKVQDMFGLADFPLASTYVTSYRFGGSSDLYIETVYGDFENKSKTGLFVTFSGIQKVGYDAYQNTLINYGLDKIDEIKDYSNSRHSIFTKNDVVVDITLDTERSTIQCWIYKSPIIRMPSLEDGLKSAIGEWFDVDKYFKKITNTYDADYTLFSIKNYAGVDYSENPLTIIALDLDTNRQSDLLNTFVKELGYKQYRDPSTNRPASYKIRGVLHSGIYHNDAGAYIDIAVYPTTDYTYTGHSAFQYRVELIIFKGNKPLEIPTYDSLEPLGLIQKAKFEKGYYNPTLPDDTVVELWTESPLNDRYVNYGFGSRNEAFVYTSSIDVAYESIVNSLLEAGYSLWGGTDNVFVMEISDNSSIHVCLLKDKARGFIRVINDLGGIDFWHN